jgi:integrase
MDSLAPGLGVRVMGRSEAPIRSFILLTRFPGSKNPTRAKIGSYVDGRGDEGRLSLEGARGKARLWQSMIRTGRDPRIEEERQRQAELQKQNMTFAAVTEDFIREKLPGERRGSDVEADIRREFLPRWKALPISDVTDVDIISVVKVKAKTAPAQARNLLGHAKRLFQWAVDQRTYGLKVSPAAGIKPAAIVGKKVARDRVLNDDELFAFWRAASRLPYPAGPAYRLLALTGLRLGEVAEASWSEFHPTVVRAIRQRGNAPIDWSQYNAEELSWTIPAARMKGQNDSARAHVVPLTPDVLAILERLPQFVGGEYLFSHNAGRKPAVMSTDIKSNLDSRMLRTLRALARKRGDGPAAVELKPWVNHDLRRNVRSGLSRLRIAEEIREAVLAHARPGIKGVYDQHDYFDEKRDALTQWGARLRSIVEPAPTASNVVALRG